MPFVVNGDGRKRGSKPLWGLSNSHERCVQSNEAGVQIQLHQLRGVDPNKECVGQKAFVSASSTINPCSVHWITLNECVVSVRMASHKILYAITHTSTLTIEANAALFWASCQSHRWANKPCWLTGQWPLSTQCSRWEENILASVCIVFGGVPNK